ncbi:hypothetical protein COCCADRAFT_97441, partial [Bipolaris zeicola 26-R-13]
KRRILRKYIFTCRLVPVGRSKLYLNSNKSNQDIQSSILELDKQHPSYSPPTRQPEATLHESSIMYRSLTQFAYSY